MPLNNRAVWYEKYKRWQIKETINGERKSFTSSIPGPAGQRECEAKALKWVEAGATKDAKLSAVWDLFVIHKQKTCGTEDANDAEKIGRLYVKKVLGKRKLSTIKPRDWQKVIDYMETAKDGKSLAKKTMMNTRGMMRTFVKWARKQEYLCGDVEVDIPKDAPKKKKRVAQPEDIKRVFATDTVIKYGKHRPEWYVHAFRFIIVNGLRRGECAGIREEDISAGVLTINRSINRLGEITDGKTENAQRRIGLSEISTQIIEQQKRMKRDAGIISPWLFCGPDGEEMDTNKLYKEWHEHYAKQLSIPCSLHELRHTFISAVKEKMPLALLQSMVGHSSDTDSIGIYGHEYGDDLKRAAAIVDDVFSGMTETAG